MIDGSLTAATTTTRTKTKKALKEVKEQVEKVPEETTHFTGTMPVISPHCFVPQQLIVKAPHSDIIILEKITSEMTQLERLFQGSQSSQGGADAVKQHLALPRFQKVAESDIVTRCLIGWALTRLSRFAEAKQEYDSILEYLSKDYIERIEERYPCRITQLCGNLDANNPRVKHLMIYGPDCGVERREAIVLMILHFSACSSELCHDWKTLHDRFCDMKKIIPAPYDVHTVNIYATLKFLFGDFATAYRAWSELQGDAAKDIFVFPDEEEPPVTSKLPMGAIACKKALCLLHMRHTRDDAKEASTILRTTLFLPRISNSSAQRIACFVQEVFEEMHNMGIDFCAMFTKCMDPNHCSNPNTLHTVRCPNFDILLIHTALAFLWHFVDAIEYLSSDKRNNNRLHLELMRQIPIDWRDDSISFTSAIAQRRMDAAFAKMSSSLSLLDQADYREVCRAYFDESMEILEEHLKGACRNQLRGDFLHALLNDKYHSAKEYIDKIMTTACAMHSIK